MANVGVLPHGAPELGVVYKFILPLAIPMLLFSANLRSVLWPLACCITASLQALQ